MPGVVELFSKGMITTIWLGRISPCWPREPEGASSVARNSKTRARLAVFLKIPRL